MFVILGLYLFCETVVYEITDSCGKLNINVKTTNKHITVNNSYHTVYVSRVMSTIKKIIFYKKLWLRRKKVKIEYVNKTVCGLFGITSD